MKPIALALFASLIACDAEPGAEPDARPLEAAEIERTVEEQLAADHQLMVDPELPGPIDEVRFALLSGALDEPPAHFEKLLGHTRLIHHALLGGVDSDRPMIFDAVAPGSYTVCVSAGPPADPARAQLAARAHAIYEADGGGPMTGEKLMAAVKKARAETGIVVERTVWRERPVSCRQVEVSEERPASRIVELEVDE